MAKLDMNGPQMHSDEWGPLLDKLLLGVTHDISNRVATLSGVSDILAGDSTIPPILRALADEVPRLEEGIRLLRLLAAPDDEGEEALETTRIVDDAIALAALHPVCRNITFQVPGRREVPPVIARPTALTHGIVIKLISAAIELKRPGEQVQIPVGFVTEQPELVICAGSASVRVRLLSAGREDEAGSAAGGGVR